MLVFLLSAAQTSFWGQRQGPPPFPPLLARSSSKNMHIHKTTSSPIPSPPPLQKPTTIFSGT